jgi:hypothetical protein
LTTLTRVSLPTTSSPFLIAAGAADVEAHRGIELERVAAGGGLGLPNITPIFMRIWLMKMTSVFERLMLPVSLRSAWRHEARLQADMLGVAHFALDFRLRRQRRDRVDDHHVDGAGAHQHVGDFSACSPVSGCETSRSSTFTPSFSAYCGSSACSASTNAAVPPFLLRLGDHLQRERGLAGRLRTVDLDDTRPRGRPPMPSAMHRDPANRSWMPPSMPCFLPLSPPADPYESAIRCTIAIA